MVKVDNTKIFLNGIYGDATVTVAASTTIKKGTVLGLNKDSELVAFSTALADSESGFKPEPTYIIAQDVTNGGSQKADFNLIRVFESGEVDASKIIFTKAADASDANVLTAMKNNGFHLCNVQQMV